MRCGGWTARPAARGRQGAAGRGECDAARRRFAAEGENPMLETLIVLLLLLWLIGLLTSYTAGGLVHLLLVIAIVVIVIRVLQGRKVL
jgi:hypothetical protein